MALQEYQDANDEPIYPPNDDWNPGAPGPWPPDNPYETAPESPPPAPPPGPIDPGAVNNPLPPAPPTSTSGGGGGGSSSGGGGSNPFATPTSFQIAQGWPDFTPPPVPTIAPLAKPPDFSFSPYEAPTPFGAFTAPTLADAENEPGYAFARDEGRKALENSAAARGVLRTGGTLKNLIGWGDKFAEQNYGNVYNRAANTYGLNLGTWGANELARAQAYDRNRANAFDTWRGNFDVDKSVHDTNAGTALDLYDRIFQGALAQFNPRFEAASRTFADINSRDLAQIDSLTRLGTAGAGL